MDERRTFAIPYLETLITKSCNLHCDGCQNYTNYAFKGMMDFDLLSQDIRQWGARIKPSVYRILGGEPLLHPRLADFIRVAAEVWPQARRIVVTNGLLAERCDGIVPALVETGTAVHLTIHSNDPQYLERLRPGISALKKWAAQSVQIGIGDSRNFIRTYKGIGRGMRPFNDDPVKSWDICTARNCLNIVESRLWKCPTISMLRDALEKFGLENSPDWKRYLKYEGLAHEATDDELAAFLNKGPEEICSICPAERPTYQKDVFNVDFNRNAEKLEVDFPPINIGDFLNSC